MHYYAIINEEYIVMEVISSTTVIDDPTYIEITEEQYNDEGFIGYFYDQDKNEFVGAVMWMCTSNEIRYNETYRTLTGKLNEIDEEIATHTHTGYVSSSELQTLEDNLQVLEDVIDTKSDANHVHSGYADSNHLHDDRYYTEDEISVLLTTKSDTTHTHTGVYDVSGAAANALSSAQAYTDSKIDALVGEGASTTLDTIGEISSAIESNQDAVDLLNSAIGNKANVSDLNSHANDTEIHITDVERESWNAKSNFSGNYNDLINQPTIPSIDGLASETYVDEKVATVTVESIGALPNTTVIPTVPTNVSAFANDAGYLTEHQSLNGLATETYVDAQISAIDIPDALSDLTTDSTHRVVTDSEKTAWNAKSNFSGSYNDLTDKPFIPSISGLATETYVDEAVSTKANSSHTHTIANVSGLQNALDGKSDSAHNHNASYDVLGAANTALVSAKEYTDDAIADEVTARDTAIATAKSSAISTASSDATTKANNALSSANAYTDSAVATVKNDLLNGAGTAYDTLKELGDLIDDNVDAIEALETVASGKANASHTHTIANVTNLQSSLDAKADSGHTHGAATTSASGFMTAAMVTKLNGIATGANAYSHPTYAARTGVPTANQTPAFGGTFTISQPVSDGTGHITAVNSRTITIPSAVVTTSANGLMSASDKSKLDGMVLATVSEVETYLGI